MNLSIRWMDNDYAISEDPVSLVDLDDSFSNTFVRDVKGVLTRANLQFNMCRGQACDGAANTQGIRNGVATQIQAEVPSAIPVHCLAHCLQLVLQEASRKCKALRESLELVREIVKPIKYSPKGSTLFAHNLETYEGRVTLKSLCPTCWTVRTAAFQAVVENYVLLQQTVEEISDTTDNEYGKKANGI